MALTQVSTDGVKNDAISHNKIPANAVQASELADNAVDTAAIAANAVTTAKIAANAVTGAEIADNLDIPDNNKIRFGTGNDLELYHDGSNSYFINNTGDFTLQNGSGNTNQIRIRGQNGEESIVANGNGSVELYHDNTKTVETHAAGLTFNQGSGNLIKYGTTSEFPNAAINIQRNGNGYANIRLSSNYGCGIFMAGANNNTDEFGINQDNQRIGYLDNRGGRIRITTGSSGLTRFTFEDSYDVTSTCNINPSSDSSKDLGTDAVRWRNVYADTLYGDGSNLTGVSSVGGATGVDFNDNVKARFGTGNDLEIYHDGTHSYIDEAANGNLVLRTNPSGTYSTIVLQAGQENSVICNRNGGVELYYDNTKQFESVNGGIAVGINTSLNGAKGTFAKDGTHLSLRSFATGGYDSIIFRSANTTVGKVHFNSGGTQYHTSSDYRRKENIVNLTGAIDRVKTLLPKRFNFKTETDVTRDGFLAHEVTAVPEAILGTKDQVATEKDVEDGKAEAVGDPIYQTIDQSALVPLLTAAVKELIAKVEVLEAA